MNPKRLLALSAFVLAAVFALSNFSGFAQQRRDKQKPAASAAGQKIDEGYTAKIKEYTTEKYFLTELVDHLPASDKVPTP